MLFGTVLSMALAHFTFLMAKDGEADVQRCELLRVALVAHLLLQMFLINITDDGYCRDV